MNEKEILRRIVIQSADRYSDDISALICAVVGSRPAWSSVKGTSLTCFVGGDGVGEVPALGRELERVFGGSVIPGSSPVDSYYLWSWTAGMEPESRASFDLTMTRRRADMSRRVAGFVVVLSDDVTEQEAEKRRQAISQIAGVQSVELIGGNIDQTIALSRARTEAAVGLHDLARSIISGAAPWEKG